MVTFKEYRRGNQELTNKTNWKQRQRKTKQKNTTQDVLDYNIREQTQITSIRHKHSYKQPGGKKSIIFMRKS